MLVLVNTKTWLPVIGFYQMAKQFSFVGFIAEISYLLDRFCGSITSRHLDF